MKFQVCLVRNYHNYIMWVWGYGLEGPWNVYLGFSCMSGLDTAGDPHGINSNLVKRHKVKQKHIGWCLWGNYIRRIPKHGVRYVWFQKNNQRKKVTKGLEAKLM